MDLDLFLQLLVSGVIRGSEFALLAASFSIIYATTRTFHVAHSVAYVAAAYGAVWSLDSLELPLWVGIPFALAMGATTGMLTEWIVYRPMRNKGATQFTVFLASLGLTIVGASVIQLLFGPLHRRLTILPSKGFSLGGISFTNKHLLVVAVASISIGALLAFLHTSSYGNAIRAAGANPRMAAIIGVSLPQIFSLVFGVGSILVGAAALVTLAGGAPAVPTMGLSPVLIGLIGVFFGGSDRVSGAIVGGFVLGMISSLVRLWLSGDWAPIVIFAALFLILIVRPQGLLGSPTR